MLKIKNIRQIVYYMNKGKEKNKCELINKLKKFIDTKNNFLRLNI